MSMGIKRLPYEEFKKQKEEKYRQTSRGFYQKEQQPAEKKPNLKTMLIKFMEALEKRHKATDPAIDEQRTLMKNHHAMMVEQQALIKNQQASINNLEVQLGQLTTLVHEKLSPKNPENKTQYHIMAIDIEEEAISEFLEALEEEPQ